METVLYALLATISRTIKDIGCKVIVTNAGALEATFTFWLFTLIFLTPLSLLKWQNHKKEDAKIIPNQMALWSLIGGGIFGILANWLFVEALKLGDFSITVPLRNLVPLFTFFMGALFLKEKVSLALFGATFLIVMGVICLHLDTPGDSFQKIVSLPSLLAILSALVFSFSVMTSRLGLAKKYGGMEVLFFTTGMIFIMVVGYAVIILLKGTLREVGVITSTNITALCLVGLLGTIDSLATSKSFALGKITVVSPLLRLHALFSVLLGGLYFKEGSLLFRLFGTTLLTIGVIIIARQELQQKNQKNST